MDLIDDFTRMAMAHLRSLVVVEGAMDRAFRKIDVHQQNVLQKLMDLMELPPQGANEQPSPKAKEQALEVVVQAPEPECEAMVPSSGSWTGRTALCQQAAPAGQAASQGNTGGFPLEGFLTGTFAAGRPHESVQSPVKDQKASVKPKAKARAMADSEVDRTTLRKRIVSRAYHRACDAALSAGKQELVAKKLGRRASPKAGQGLRQDEPSARGQV